MAGRKVTIVAPEYHPDMKLADLPIPETVTVTDKWPEQMQEMAAHIGPYHTLRIIERFGGQQVYIASDPEKNLFRVILDASLTRTMSQIYGRSEMELPTGKGALNEAKRAPVLASVRNGDMTVREAARILASARSYISRLVNQSEEGQSAQPLRRPGKHDPRQIDMFETAEK